MILKVIGLGAACVLVTVSAQASEWGGLKLGMTEATAWTTINARGTAKRYPLQLKGQMGVLLSADGWNAQLCNGKVYMITHRFEPSFDTFTREMRVAVAERGPPGYEVNSLEGTPHISSVIGRWPLKGGVTYSLGYWEIDKVPVTSESLVTPCP